LSQPALRIECHSGSLAGDDGAEPQRAQYRSTFATSQISEVSNHYGAICTMGIGCSTGGDRGLLDFLSVTVGLHGEANVVWPMR